MTCLRGVADIRTRGEALADLEKAAKRTLSEAEERVCGGKLFLDRIGVDWRKKRGSADQPHLQPGNRKVH